MGAKRAGNYQPLRTSTPLNRSGASLRICSAQVRTAAGGGVPGHSQSGCYPGDQHGLTAQGTQPPLHRRAGQPHSALSQAGGLLPPHPAAAGTGEAPHAHHQLPGPPPHRHVNQTPGHRPRACPWAPQALQNGSSNPGPHAALDHRALNCEVLAHRGQPQGVQPQEGRQIRTSEGSLRHVEVSRDGCVAAPIIRGPRPLPTTTTHPPPPRTHQ